MKVSLYEWEGPNLRWQWNTMESISCGIKVGEVDETYLEKKLGPLRNIN